MKNSEFYQDKYRIQSTRLYGYDYSWPGFYFVTICTKDKVKYLGEVTDIHHVELSEIGKIADNFWREIPKHYPNVRLGEFIVMPNHIHGIIEIGNFSNETNNLNEPVETRNCASLRHRNQCPSIIDWSKLPINMNDLNKPNKFANIQSQNLSAITRAYKSTVKNYANKNCQKLIWQGRFHDEIIRNEEGYNKIQDYIKNNPRNWLLDRNYII